MAQYTELRYFHQPPKQAQQTSQQVININNQISELQQQINTKVDKQYNRQLSQKNFTIVDKNTISKSQNQIVDLQNQIDSLPDIVQSDWNTQDVDDMSYIKNKPNVPILDQSGQIPASYLPSYVDDVLEYPSFHDLPQPGEPGKIYVTTDNDLTYRWSGTTYVEISKSIITGVKGDAEANYRIGNVNLTAANIGLGNVVNIDQSKAIKGITRNGLTFTYTCLDGTTGTFTQQDNNTTYSAGTGLQLTNTAFSVKLGYTTSGNNRAVQADANGNLYVTQKDDNTWTAWKGATASANGTAGYMPAPTKAQYQQFLRGDGTWVSLNNYSLPLAADGTRGGIQIGYTQSGKNYPVQLSSEKAYVNVPWTDTTYNFSGVSFTSGQSGTGEHNANNITSNGVWYYTSNGPATTLGASTTDGALYSQAYSTSWVGQIAQDYRNGRLFVRGKNNNTWQNWLRVALYSEIPTKVSQLTNDSGFITGITKAMVTTALGYTPPTTDTNTHRPIQVNGTEILGNNTTALNLKAGSNVTLANSSGTVTITSTNTWRPLGTGASDACAGNDSRLSNSRPASDVYAWAKASTKPSYAFNEISAGTATIGDGTNYILLRSNASWRGGVYWHTTGNEAMVFGNKNSASSFIFANTDPVDRTQWNTLSPWMQIKKGCVYINSLIENGVNPSYNLYVNGTANITGQLDVTGAINTDSYVNCTNLNAIDDVTISKGSGAARLRISNAGVLNANNVIEFSQDNSGNTKHFQLQDRMDSGNTRRYFSIWGYNYGSLISASCASGSSYCCVGIGGGSSLLWDTTAKLYVNGNAKASAWNTTSDIRLKDIKEDTNISIETIANAPLFYFYWKDKQDENKHVGTSAQYWQKVLPEVVSGTDESKFTVDYGVTALTSAITVAREVVEQDKKIKQLEEENKQLKEELQLLKSQINDILTTINKSTNNE